MWCFLLNAYPQGKNHKCITCFVIWTTCHLGKDLAFVRVVMPLPLPSSYHSCFCSLTLSWYVPFVLYQPCKVTVVPRSVHVSIHVHVLCMCMSIQGQWFQHLPWQPVLSALWENKCFPVFNLNLLCCNLKLLPLVLSLLSLFRNKMWLPAFCTVISGKMWITFIAQQQLRNYLHVTVLTDFSFSIHIFLNHRVAYV